MRQPITPEADAAFMRVAIDEALKGLGRTSPNPIVGAVLVRGGKIVGRGHHRQAGKPHAEVECLRKFGRRVPPDASMYITLEPCSTSGRTPPCTDALIESGLKRIVVGAVDPNPQHAGRGVDLLRAAGIDIVDGVLPNECSALNLAFNKWILTRRPFVIAKCGMSLDGCLTRPNGEERWITSAASRQHANRFRGQVDAILVGAETVRSDNPRLTTRSSARARQPWRIVLTRSGRLPNNAHLFRDRFADRTRIFRDQSLERILDSLGKDEITSVLIEGGGEILSQALDQKLIDRFHIYVGPVLTGGATLAFGGDGAAATAGAVRLRDVNYERIGPDLLVTANAEYAASGMED